MKEGHIFIQGIISPWQDKAAEEWGEVNVKQVTKQLQENNDAEKLIVHIHSPGGDVDEGFAIHDILVASGKEIETRIEGLCASIATVISLAGSVRLITENSEFMIHTPFGINEGDADEMQKYTDQLKAVEEKILDFYVKKTGSDKEAIQAMMKSETWLSANQALELGFVTDIITTIKAVAYFKPKNHLKMNNEDFQKSLDSSFEKFWNKIKEILNIKGIKNLTVTTADDVVLDFGDQIETVEEIAVGMTANIEGNGPASGEYVMTDGKTFVFDSGSLTEIKEPEETGTEEMEALKQENENLKQQVKDKDEEIKQLKEAQGKIEKEFENLKKQVKSDVETFEKNSVQGKQTNQEPENRFAGLKAKI